SDPGRVIVQALQPNHYAIEAALAHDTDRFFAIENVARQDAGYPPHARIGLIRLESVDDSGVLKASQSVAEAARSAIQGESARVLGPAPAPIERVRDRWRQMILVMAASPAKLVQILRRTQMRLPALPRSVNVIFDVDPVDLL
ncbi:MAG: primosomal protein N', partial [Planctomycetota bacterium]